MKCFNHYFTLLYAFLLIGSIYLIFEYTNLKSFEGKGFWIYIIYMIFDVLIGIMNRRYRIKKDIHQ